MTTDLKNKTGIQKFLSIAQWISSIIFLIIAIAAMKDEIIPAFMMLIIGIILLPPVDKILSQKYQKVKLHPLLAKTIIIVILIIITGIAIPENKVKIANDLYENEKIKEAIVQLNEIKPKDINEEKLKESLIKKYSADLILYQQDKNLFYYNHINEEFKKENYNLVISIFEKVDKNSTYNEKLKAVVENSYNKLNFNKDKKYYDEAYLFFNEKKYQDAIDSLNKISKYTEFLNNGLKLKTEAEKLLKAQIAQKEIDAIKIQDIDTQKINESAIETQIFNSIKILENEIDNRIKGHKECDIRASINFFGMNICQKSERDLLFKVLEKYYRSNNFDEYEIVSIRFYTGKYATNWKKYKTFYNCAIMKLPDEGDVISLDIQSFYIGSKNKHIECNENGSALDGIRKIKR